MGKRRQRYGRRCVRPTFQGKFLAMGSQVGATFEELYYSNDYGSCPTLTYAGPLAGARVMLQCNFDNTITYGEDGCGAECSCAFQDVYGPGCYRATDALPGTAWFFMTAGCDCTDAKANHVGCNRRRSFEASLKWR